jgi:hypothetical protein
MAEDTEEIQSTSLLCHYPSLARVFTAVSAHAYTSVYRVWSPARPGKKDKRKRMEEEETSPALHFPFPSTTTMPTLLSLSSSLPSSLLSSLPPPPTLKQWGYIGLAGVVASQASWMLLKARMGLRGPLFRPFGGFLTLVKMVVDPVGFWDSMTAYAKEKGMSLETLFGVPVVFVTDNQLSKEV